MSSTFFILELYLLSRHSIIPFPLPFNEILNQYADTVSLIFENQDGFRKKSVPWSYFFFTLYTLNEMSNYQKKKNV